MSLLRTLIGHCVPLCFSVPQNIKDRLRARGFNADIYPMSFYQELGDRIIAKARSTTASRIGQMEICVELAEEAAILIMGQHRP